MRTFLLVSLWICFTGITANAQNYHAVNGSSYAGSLGIGNNPASIVNTPFKWDVDLFSFQVKNATNVITILNYSLLSNPANSEYFFTGGDYARKLHLDYNINLLNGRFAINRKQAFGFGINLRGYTNAKSTPYNFIDTLHTSREFFNLGNYNRTLGADGVTSNWIELFGTYSQTIWDRRVDRLNAGITLKVTRGLAGARMNVQNGRVSRRTLNDQVIYEVDNAISQYGYSANLDSWLKENSTSQNLRNLFTNAQGGASVDLGVEYLVRSKVPPAVWDDVESYYDYEWKIGLSLLDIGFNRYRYGLNSRRTIGFNENIVDSTLDEKFGSVSSFREFNDSLATVVKTMGNLRGPVNIMNPTRLVLNVDRYLGGNWFVNGDLSINLSQLDKKKFYVQSLNLLTVTPRWETKSLGFYMPVTVNTEGRMWVGGAFKVGPLLFGIHNWANVFSKKKINNGGGYLAIVIRSKQTVRQKDEKIYTCPDL